MFPLVKRCPRNVKVVRAAIAVAMLHALEARRTRARDVVQLHASRCAGDAGDALEVKKKERRKKKIEEKL